MQKRKRRIKLKGEKIRGNRNRMLKIQQIMNCQMISS